MSTTDSRSTGRLDLADVLYDEYTRLRPEWTDEALGKVVATLPPRDPREDPHTTRVATLYGAAHRPPDGRRLAALCLSGGGIRSATFNLGVIQALAGAKVLDRFDYLSSVSGGGYVASWLQGWLYRARGVDGEPLKGLAQLERIRVDLEGARKDPIRPEARAIRHLREYSNYLTPELGLLSVDTWTSIAIVVRNIFLNWLVVLPILAAILAVPRLAVVPWAARPFDHEALFVAGLAIALVGLVFMNALRGVTRKEGFATPLPVGVEPPKSSGLRHRLGALKDYFLLLGLAPLLVGVCCIVAASTWVDLGRYAAQGMFGDALVPGAILGLALPIAAFLIAIPVQKILGRDWPGAIPVDFVALVVAGAVETVAYAFILSHWATTLWAWPHVFFIVAPTLVLTPMLIGKSLFVAFASYAEGKYKKPTGEERGWRRLRALAAAWTARPSEYGDALREWWARWSAWVCIALVTWMVGSAIVYLTPWAMQKTNDAVVGAGGLTLGGVISYFGKSALTPAKDGKGSWTQFALNLGVPLFCLLLAMVVSYGTGAAIDGVSGAIGTPVDGPFVLATIAVLLIFGVCMGWFVNVNRFSLQAFYRNRLVRCYLGASHVPFEGKPGKEARDANDPKDAPEDGSKFTSKDQSQGRQPNFFTGFDPDDNIRLADLADNRPLPVVNMALNLVGGANLAWQQRKADSFTASPLHCGNAALGYRHTWCYGGDSGMSLGTAVAISGAAANPNMGYNSSPAIAFVMTLFNARLGAWLGNPGEAGERTHASSGPGATSPYWMLAEAFGGTNETSAYVNLSDGGHFDNLGLYEMVRRRCGVILVCDAGQDGECRFDDLGTAIRNVRVDFGIPITFPSDGIKVFPKVFKDRDSRAGYCAIGAIKYGEVDEDAPDGVLIYLKPAICEDGEPYDVYNYARASKDFPHESTVDQWFSESQFEAYRILGKTAMQSIMGGPSNQSFARLEDLGPLIENYLKTRGRPIAAPKEAASQERHPPSGDVKPNGLSDPAV